MPPLSLSPSYGERAGVRGSIAAEQDEERQMQFEQFKSSLNGAAPPAGISGAAQALWWQAKGDWHQAHRCCQGSPDATGAWAHAYLHRVEGDQSNSAGWYKRAGKNPSTATLEQEWEEIARAVLASS